MQFNLLGCILSADIVRISTDAFTGAHFILFCVPQAKMADPAVSGNPSEFQKVAMAAAELQERVDSYENYCRLELELAEAKEMLKDSDGALDNDSELKLRFDFDTL